MKCTFSRGGYYVEIDVPKPTEDLIVIPSNMKGTGFMRNTWRYNKKYLEGLLTEDAYNLYVDKCS
jgi:hypothetical protein